MTSPTMKYGSLGCMPDRAPTQVKVDHFKLLYRHNTGRCIGFAVVPRKAKDGAVEEICNVCCRVLWRHV